MALDIAVIQDKYGVNEDWATGNNTYVLKDVNEWGVYIDAATGQPAEHDATNADTTRDGYYEGQSTFYSSIWDADGVDQIVYNGARNTNIDLRAATLQYETGGAGWMSYANGIFGGSPLPTRSPSRMPERPGNDTAYRHPSPISSPAAAPYQMSCGLGKHTYIVDTLGELVSEAASEAATWSMRRQRSGSPAGTHSSLSAGP